MSDTWPSVGLTITERFRRIAAGAVDEGDNDEVDDVDGDDGNDDDDDNEESFQVLEIHFTKPSCGSCGQWVKVFFSIKIIITMTIMIITIMIRFFETETASICLDFTECGPCFESTTWA